MGTRLYVGNLPYSATEEEIREFFKPRHLTEVRIINDRDTGRPRGYCFVECETAAAAQSAIAELNGLELGGRSIVVNEAKERASSGSNGRRERGGDGRRNRW